MARIRVLLVDDSEEFLASASGLLANFGHIEVVGTARSGMEGVELTARLTPDIVLMDLVMPGMNGFRATALIKAQRDPPLVLVTTLHDLPEFRRGAADAGADGFVPKADFFTAMPGAIDSLFTGRADPDEGAE